MQDKLLIKCGKCGIVELNMELWNCGINAELNSRINCWRHTHQQITEFQNKSVESSHGRRVLFSFLIQSINLRCILFRPYQLVYLDQKGYRLALDSTDESNYIEAKSGVIEKTAGKLEAKINSTSDSYARSSNDSLVNGYDETEAKSESERDESIDYNMGWDEFPEEPKR